MKASFALITLLSEAALVFALPGGNRAAAGPASAVTTRLAGARGRARQNARGRPVAVGRGAGRGRQGAAATVTVTVTAAAAQCTDAAGGVGGGEVADPNKQELKVKFGDQTALNFGDVQVDLLFDPSTSGTFELEFKDATANTVAVTENKNPGKAPAGFVFFEPTTFVVKLGAAAPGASLQKIDYFFDPAAIAAKTFDLTKVKIGKLDAATNTFTVDNVGELEFEADENEFTLTVDDLNGEWGIFASSAAADVVAGLKVEADGKTELLINSTFGAATVYVGGGLKQDVLFPGNAAGEFEVELSGASPATVIVTENTRLIDPPAGFLYVDPRTYKVATTLVAASAVDLQKIDFFFSQAVRDAIDVTGLAIGKLNAAGTAFEVGAAIGEFELEDDENEITVKVADLNGEWAILASEASVKASAVKLLRV